MKKTVEWTQRGRRDHAGGTVETSERFTLSVEREYTRGSSTFLVELTQLTTAPVGPTDTRNRSLSLDEFAAENLKKILASFGL